MASYIEYFLRHLSLRLHRFCDSSNFLWLFFYRFRFSKNSFVLRSNSDVRAACPISQFRRIISIFRRISQILFSNSNVRSCFQIFGISSDYINSSKNFLRLFSNSNPSANEISYVSQVDCFHFYGDLYF